LLVYARSPAEAEQIWQQLLAPPLPLASLSLPGTPLAAAGLAIWQRWAQASRTAAGLSRLELLTICALGPSSSSLPLLLSEQVGGDYAGQLLELADRLGLGARPLFRWLQRPAEQLGHQTLRAIKQALLLHDWAAGLAGAELEAKFQVFTGTIGRVASEAADRLDWLAEVSAQVGFGAAEQQPLHELGEVLRQRPVDGVAEHAPLASPVPGLSRTIGCLVGALHAKAGGPVAAAAPTAQTPPRRAAWQRTGS
jgi:hypothetical protein